jgi:hypothetical protein
MWQTAALPIPPTPITMTSNIPASSYQLPAATSYQVPGASYSVSVSTTGNPQREAGSRKLEAGSR